MKHVKKITKKLLKKVSETSYPQIGKQKKLELIGFYRLKLNGKKQQNLGKTILEQSC